MRKFRLPRKTKKRLRGLWLYKADENGNSLMAFPKKYQEDYTALKQGLVKNIIDNKNSKKKSLEFFKKIDIENYVSDKKLKFYIDDYFREDLRKKYFKVLLEAKTSLKAKKCYFNFVNAYELQEKDGSYSNIPALAVEQAEKLLKKKYKKKRHSKK